MMHGSGLLLLSAVAGYWVLERASSHKGDVRRVGKVVGWLVIVLSFAGLVCNLWCTMRCSNASGKFFKGYCPLTPRSSPVPAPAQ